MPSSDIKQIYIPYYFWEEYYAGMWRFVYGEERQRLFKKAITFTGNAKLYGEYMLKAIKLWVYSCTNTFTNPSMNHQAWVGHAACCIALNCPEDITRLAWHELTQQQQDEANAQADRAIELWFDNYKRGIQPCLKPDLV